MATVYELNSPPIKNAQFVFEMSLTDTSDTNVFVTSPTIEAGDVTVYQDGALDGNIDSLPSEIGSSGVLTVTLSAAEMNADRVVVRFHDQTASEEWQDALITIRTVLATTVSDFDESTDEVDIGSVRGAAVTSTADFQADATAANQTTIQNRLGAFDGTGDNTLLGFLLALMRSDANLPSQIGEDWVGTTDSTEGMYDSLSTGAGSATATNQTEILDRIGAFSGDGGNDILGWLQAMMRSDITTLPSQIGGNWDDAADSLEAIRDYVATIAGLVPAEVWAEAMSTYTTDGTFGDQLRDIESKIWSGSETRSLTYGTVPTDDVVEGNQITHYRGTRWSETISSLSLPTTTRTETYLTIKSDKAHTDSQAIIQISENSGLLRLNGADGTRTHATLTVASDGTSVTYTVEAAATQNISIATGDDEVNYYYDIKTIASDVGSQVHNPGLWKVVPDIGRAIS